MDSFLIGPVKEGLRKDIKPYATPEDSFETLTNAYQWRGRIVRRPGYTLLARLSTDGGTTFLNHPVMGLATRYLTNNSNTPPFTINQQQLIAFDTTRSYVFSGTTFSTLSSVMPVTWNGADYNFFWTTNYAGGFWATNFIPGFHGWAVQAFAGAAGTGTTATVQVTAAGNNVQVGDFVYFLNVQGAAAPNNLIYAVVTVAGNPFTVRALVYPKGVNSFTNGAATKGSVLDSTQSISGQDGIRYYANTSIGATWVNYNPPVDPNNALVGALMVFSYRGYLVFLNTWEGNEQSGSVFNYPNRARWTQIGTPYYSDPAPNTPAPQTVDPTAARDDLFGKGGANDAPVNDVIVNAGFVRDILVVYFQNSTWRLRFVNNSQNPFVWERVNIELGNSSTFSGIVFDKGLMGIGRRGIVISDANDTVRFDEKIPDDIFEIRQNNNGLQRVYGIRTFRTRLLYWTIPSDFNPSGIYPDQVLVFNYDTKNWSYFDDCFTCFGYFYPSQSGLTWSNLTDPWESYTSRTWDSGTSEQGYETVVAGNQQGFVFKLEQESPVNDPSLLITAISGGGGITSSNHNLPDGTWITLSGITGTIASSDGVSLNGRNYKISFVDANTFNLNEFKPISAGNASGANFGVNPTYNISYTPIQPGSVQINVGTLVFTDTDLDGNLFVAGVKSGTVDYNTGALVLNFSPSIGSTAVNVRVVSLNPSQTIDPVSTTGAYTGDPSTATVGQIAKISNFDIQSKIFNFFGDDQRSRLSKIDFYTNNTASGQFICNVFGDSSDIPINSPLPDNPQHNVVLTSAITPQVGQGDQSIYRLYCSALAQTIQMQFTLSDRQIAVNAINAADLEIVALMVTMRRGGRLV